MLVSDLEVKMSTQTRISQYFSNRKRHVDEIKSVNQGNKLLSSDLLKPVTKDSGSSDESRLVLKRKISWEDDQVPKKKIVSSSHHNPKRTPKFTTLRTSIKKSRVRSAERSNVRKNLFDVTKRRLDLDSIDRDDTSERQNSESVGNESAEDQSTQETLVSDKGPLVRDKEPFVENKEPLVGDKGPLVGDKEPLLENKEPLVENKEPLVENKEPLVENKEPLVENNEPPVAPSNPSTSKQTSLREELGLGELKSRLKSSSRLGKLRDAIKSFDKGYDKLCETRAKLDSKVRDTAPRLKEFDSIEIEVPASPVKSYKWDTPTKVFSSPSKLREAAFRSPAKSTNPTLPYVSPRKLLEEMRCGREGSSTKSDYYNRCSMLAAQQGKPFLPLPHSYRTLAELFKSLDVVLSMIQARKEQAHFSKVKPSTQQLCKKTLSEHHLGQMLKVFPNAFRLSYEKVKQQSGKPDKHELTIHPPVSQTQDGGSDGVISSGLERQRYFYKQLLDLVKTHHQEYLLSQTPAIVVDKDKLTRWHPGFDVDSCPDIESVQLPVCPRHETYTSAKQLFGKAKELFMINPRMEKALDKLPKSDNILSNGKPSAAASLPGLANAIRGIPKSLLEKVRAKQAAKAVEMLTRDPVIAKQEIELSRLPEMARILRYLFVVERKNVMTKSRILDKLSSSFRENLSAGEMERHLMLLVERTGSWLKLHKDHNVTFITMNKSMEMNNVYNSINSPTSGPTS